MDGTRAKLNSIELAENKKLLETSREVVSTLPSFD